MIRLAPVIGAVIALLLVGGIAIASADSMSLVGAKGSTIPAAFSGSYTIGSGGTAQTLAAAGEITTGCLIKNPLTATQQNIMTAESVFINFNTTATAAAGGTSVELAAGDSIACPGKTLLAVSIIAATTGHRIEGFKF